MEGLTFAQLSLQFFAYLFLCQTPIRSQLWKPKCVCNTRVPSAESRLSLKVDLIFSAIKTVQFLAHLLKAMPKYQGTLLAFESIEAHLLSR